MRKKIFAVLALAILLALSMAPSAWAVEMYGSCGAQGDNVTWVLNDSGTLTISGTGAMKDYTNTVTPWGRQEMNVKRVVIENGVSYIGDWAFVGCRNLVNVNISATVSNIGTDVFPSLVNSFTSINVDVNNLNYSSSNGVLFNKDRTILIKCPSGKLGNYTIPSTVNSIEVFAFEGCNHLTNITIPDSVINIGNLAFSMCSSLNAINIPYGITQINNGTFSECSKLNNITIPDSIISIDGFAFSDCDSLSNVIIPDSVTSIGEYVFSSCNNLSNVKLSNNLGSIGEGAFLSCDKLSVLTIPASVVSIGSTVSGNGVDVNENNPVYSSEDGVLFNKDKTILFVYPYERVGAYNVPNNVKIISENAFRYANDLTIISIPVSVTNIEDSFWTCSKLTDVYYAGSESQWNDIIISEANEPLINANIHYLGEDDKPTSDINNPEVFVKQSTNEWCTYAASAMMLRRRAILDDITDWQSITDVNVRNYSYVSGVGMSNGYSYRGMYVECEGVSKRADKKAYFIRIMQEYPEGIVVYNRGKGGRWHAVLLADYDAKTDTFYCVDPASNMIGKGRIPLSQSSIIKSKPDAGQTQDMVIDYITSIWFISGNSNKKVLTSTDIQSNCPIEMQVTIGNELLNSTGLSGITTNGAGDITMTANGSGIERNVKVTIPGSYVIGENIDVELQGTDTGSMVFTVTHTYSDNTQETQTFENVPVSATTVAKTSSIYPQSSVVLNVTDKNNAEVENIWSANPNETVNEPAPVFDTDKFDYYKISFDTDGGILVNKTNPDYVIRGEAYKMPGATKSRHTLTAWAIGAKDSKNQVKANDVYTFTEDTTVYAIWQYNGGGGGSHSNRPSGGGTNKPTNPDKPGNSGTPSTGTNTVTAANIKNVFADVQNNAWYSEAIAYVYNKGMMNGTEKGFEPNASTTRAMLVTMLYRLENEPAAGAAKFSDVASGQWFSNAVVWAADRGVVNGYENGTFAPNAELTREQLATILYRFAQLKGYDVTVQGDLSSFSDGAKVSDWAQEAMQWAVGAGIINGDNNALKPAGNATRAEVAMMLMRFIENMK